MPGSGTTRVHALATYAGDAYIGLAATGATTVSGSTTVTPASTVTTWPTLTLIGPSSASATFKWLVNYTAGMKTYWSLVVYAGETVRIDFSASQRRVVSDYSGENSAQPRAGSDDFYLLPRANLINTFWDGTLTAAVALLHWTPAHWSVDGVA